MYPARFPMREHTMHRVSPSNRRLHFLIADAACRRHLQLLDRLERALAAQRRNAFRQLAGLPPMQPEQHRLYEGLLQDESYLHWKKQAGVGGRILHSLAAALEILHARHRARA